MNCFKSAAKIMLIFAMFFSSSAQASRFTLHIGPPSAGNGGSNPLSIPPVNPIDYEIVYVTKRQREWSLSLIPGILYGTRMWFSPLNYVSLGGGLGMNIQGLGPAMYAAFGLDWCKALCFNLEYKKALIISSIGLSSAYAIRAGISVDF